MQAVTNDEEHARLIAEAAADAPAPDPHPSLVTWSPEVEAIAGVRDEIKQLTLVIIATNSKKGAALPKFKPTLRPATLLERLTTQKRYERREAKHRALVARVLPHKRQQ